MAWSFSADRPVYIQIADRIKKSVLSGEYEAGQQIPTVRQLALDAAVNPNTVQHAFVELENQGIIIAKGTLGRFVTDNQQVVQAVREDMARRLAKTFVEEMGQLSISPQQALELIKEVET